MQADEDASKHLANATMEHAPQKSHKRGHTSHSLSSTYGINRSSGCKLFELVTARKCCEVERCINPLETKPLPCRGNPFPRASTDGHLDLHISANRRRDEDTLTVVASNQFVTSFRLSTFGIRRRFSMYSRENGSKGEQIHWPIFIPTANARPFRIKDFSAFNLFMLVGCLFVIYNRTPNPELA